MDDGQSSLIETGIPSEVVTHFGSSLLHIDWQISYFLDEQPESIRQHLEHLMSSIPDAIVRARINDPQFGFVHERTPAATIEQEARRDILAQDIARAVNRRRISFLRSASQHSRPPPYDHPALADLPITDEALIDIAHFDTSRGLLLRNGFVFELAPSLPAFNASYWLIRNLYQHQTGVTRLIRLDPLCIQPLDAHRGAEYKMWIYGVPLDWTKLAKLKNDQHGRWMPGALSTPSAFTDVVWSPRPPEVHFACEEVPTLKQGSHRGSRYLHAIYLPEEARFVHIDGALRYYSHQELTLRQQSHVRSAGKAGQRVKIFRADGPIEPETWSALASSFFVWNYDVMRYVSGEDSFPEQTENGAVTMDA